MKTYKFISLASMKVASKIVQISITQINQRFFSSNSSQNWLLSIKGFAKNSSYKSPLIWAPTAPLVSLLHHVYIPLQSINGFRRWNESSLSKLNQFIETNNKQKIEGTLQLRGFVFFCHIWLHLSWICLICTTLGEISFSITNSHSLIT